jgi:D-alanyl-D-alanine carboxypeptidase/D-alanyl-D-alanine-endopeptidase (penicillin-binding protein 4)
MPAAALFVEWRNALTSAGIQRVEGRLIGDDNAFDDQTLGAGWAWDYLTLGYAAPSSALSYNENVVVVRVSPGAAAGDAASVALSPPGHELDVTSVVTTSAADVPASIGFERLPGRSALVVRGSIPIDRATLVLTTTIANPTRYFVEALRLALRDGGMVVSHGAWDIDDLATDALRALDRRVIATHQSPPLSVLAGYAMKVSQNFYGDMLLKAVGAHAARTAGAPGIGSAETGRAAVSETLTAWELPVDALSMVDGSGLSRYNYASANLLVGVLKHAWHDERLRGPFVASLPVGGHDGTLQNRMRNSALERRVLCY